MTAMTQETNDVVTQELIERLRNASQLAQKKYVTNSSELFNLAADALQSQSARIAELMEKNDKLAKWLYEACGGFPVSEEAFAAIAPDLPVVAREMSRPFKGRSLAEFRAEIEEKIASLTKDSTSGN